MTSQETQSNTTSEPSVDTTPLDPRGESNEEEDEPRLPSFPEPSPDWKFNIFLNKLSDCIPSEEFKKLKDFFIGIVGKKLLEKCETVTDVFTIMRQQCFLNHDNILYLQSLIFHLKRPDLLQECVEYATFIGDVLHFYTPPESAAENHRLVRFHVDGKDFVNCKRTFIQKLRRKVSGILCVPEQHIIIVGVEPSSSMLITLMIPDMYADLLEEMILGKEGLNDLVNIGIDVIGMGGTQHNIRVSEIEEAEIILTDQQTKLVNVYQQLQEKTKQMEESQIECLTLSKKLKMYEKTYMSNDAVLMTFQKMFNTIVPAIPPKGEPASRKSQEALADFKSMLKSVEKEDYDRDLIIGLLEVNTSISVTRLNEAYLYQIERLYLELNDLKSRIDPLSLELQKYQFLLQVDTQELDEIIFNTLLRPILDALQIQAQMPRAIRYMESSKKASRMLRYKEKMKLKQGYHWEKDDRITLAIERDPDMFLTCIFVKEIETTGNAELNLVEFLTKCLEDVGRKDIVAKFHEWIKVPVQPPPSSDGGKKRSKKKQTTVTSPRDSSKTRKEGTPDQSQSNHDALSAQLKAIGDKVDSICTMMETHLDKPPSYTSLCDGNVYPFTMTKRQQMNSGRMQNV